MSTLADPPSVQTSPQGYYFAEMIQIQGTPIGDFYDALMRGMTHKMNNFLAVIQGFSSLILMSDGLETSVKENLDQMKEASQGAKVLAERILSARGTVRLTPQSINLREYIPLIETNLRSLFSKNGVPLQINVAPDTPPVWADNTRLKEILMELMNNAAEAVQMSGRQGSATLEIVPPLQTPGGRPDHVDIFVRNTGMTISPEKVRDMFKSFHSTKDSRHPGIGLTIVQMLGAQMGIRVGAKNENETTTFWLSVPKS